jgi:F-type H+-transporting ATPase subunit delta
MAVKLSRRKITGYIADQLVSGSDHGDVIRQLAALLIDTGRTKELDLIVRDIEYELQRRGIVLAQVTTAFDMSDATKRAVTELIQSYTHADHIHLRQFIEPDVLGGFKIDLPGRQRDATIARALTTLRNNKK